MKTFSILPLLAASALALAATQPAFAVTHSFTTTLTGAANNNSSTATGSATVVFDDAASNVAVNLTFAGLSAPASAAHIHCCIAPPGNTGVALGFSAFPGASSGTYSATLSTFSGTNTYASVLAGALAGHAYINIHDQNFPGGEIRGFLTAVPEPASVALLLAGLGVVGVAGRRRAAQPASASALA